MSHKNVFFVEKEGKKKRGKVRKDKKKERYKCSFSQVPTCCWRKGRLSKWVLHVGGMLPLRSPHRLEIGFFFDGSGKNVLRAGATR